MPNHITNELIFRCGHNDQERILAALCKDGNVDFEVLVPLPLNIWWGNVGIAHEEAFKRTALDWSRENWGTKWNAYSHRETVRTPDSITFVFDTAWRAPYGWLAAVFNSLKLSFDHNWFDEGSSWSVSGVFDYAALVDDKCLGEAWKQERASEETHKRLHVLKFGCERFDDEDAA